MFYANSQALIAVVRSTLIGSSDVTDIVGGRVYGAHPQSPDSPSISYPMVILEIEGGSSGYSSTYQTVQMFLYSYSRVSAGEAIRCYDACHEALHAQKLQQENNTTRGYAEETQRPDQGYNDQAKAYFCRGMFTLRTVTSQGAS